jgi:hypothetical protein
MNDQNTRKQKQCCKAGDTEKEQNIEVVKRCKYLGTVISGTNDETEEIRARILAANKAYSSLQTIIRSKEIHRNYKIRLHKTLIKPVLCNGSVTSTLTQTTEQMLQTFERKILRRIYGATQEEGRWCPRWNNELYRLYIYLLTPWSRVLPEKLKRPDLLKKFPAFYATRRFITAFTRAHHLSLS